MASFLAFVHSPAPLVALALTCLIASHCLAADLAPAASCGSAVPAPAPAAVASSSAAPPPFNKLLTDRSAAPYARGITQPADKPVHWPLNLDAPRRTVDLKIGETQEVVLADGSKAKVKLLSIDESRDSLRDAVRRAVVKVVVNESEASLVAGNYNLPIMAGGVQLACTVTRGYVGDKGGGEWQLSPGVDARLRLWPAGSPWINRGTFGYPVRQRWFASDTQMAGEPTFVDGVETPGARRIYYHSALDFGGLESVTEVVAAAESLVIVAGQEYMTEFKDLPAASRYDSVYLYDHRGWVHRYSHLQAIDPAVKVGRVLKMGERIGLLGKEGDSGGWSHLHYQIFARQPSGKWGDEEGYPYIWQAYLQQQRPRIIAVARPHQVGWTGQKVTLDGSKSWSAAGKIARYEWTFSDGTTAAGPVVEKSYGKPGEYNEVLKVTDAEGRVDYDFLVVQIADQADPQNLPPGIHAAYMPTLGLKPGDTVTFQARTFLPAKPSDATAGGESWDFGDGSPVATTRSDGGAESLAADGYATITHKYEKPGHYIVTVRRSNEKGLEGVTRLHVRVGEEQ